MSVIAIINIIIINIMAWLALSYFWSHWTYKIFKPWAWLELKKKKLLVADEEKIERRYPDRNRLYSYFFLAEQIEQQMVEGEIVMAGIEDADLVSFIRMHCPERTLRVIDFFEQKNITVTKENCQGEVSTQVVKIGYISDDEIKKILPDSDLNIIMKGDICKNLDMADTKKVALMLIDSVDYDTVGKSLSWAYNHLSQGGAIVIHDYNHDWENVRRAADRYVRQRSAYQEQDSRPTLIFFLTTDLSCTLTLHWSVQQNHLRQAAQASFS